MLTISRILFPTDFSDSATRAFPYAVGLTRRYGAELHMLHALALHADDPADAERRFPPVEEEAGAAADGGARVTRAVRRGVSAASVILDYATEEDVDLVVMGTHGRRGLRRFVLGSVAEEVVRFADRAVLTVREDAPTGTDGEFRRIVAPVDFSRHSRQAVAHARELAAEFGAELHLLHVVQLVVYPDFYLPGAAAGLLDPQTLRREAVRRLEELLEETEGPAVRADATATIGPVIQEIVEFTRQKHADLLVIASHGLTGVLELLLGSVTEKVVRLAPCSVLTLKAGGRSLLRPAEEASSRADA